jgi:hypothetical protein
MSDTAFDPNTKAGRLRRACYELLLEHNRNDDIPTNGRFLFYKLEQRGHLPKHYDPARAEPAKRTPSQDLSDATMWLREAGLVPWSWIVDESRSLSSWNFAPTIADYLREAVAHARLDAWDGEPPPLITCEARATAGVLVRLTMDHLTPITATGGQCAGHIVNEIIPLLRGNKRPVLYIGDYELRGPAEQIESNTRRVIERHTGRVFSSHDWVKIALTEEKVTADSRLRGLAIEKIDRRYKPPKRYEAVECEALGQGVLVRMIRHQLEQMRAERGLPAIEEMQARDEAERERMLAELDRLGQQRGDQP